MLLLFSLLAAPVLFAFSVCCRRDPQHHASCLVLVVLVIAGLMVMRNFSGLISRLVHGDSAPHAAFEHGTLGSFRRCR
jgi:NADH:ubiquinone oxidoreductase subunit 6 (subunit J)